MVENLRNQKTRRGDFARRGAKFLKNNKQDSSFIREMRDIAQWDFHVGQPKTK